MSEVWALDAHPDVKAGMERFSREVARWVDAGLPLTGPAYERKVQAGAAMGALAYQHGCGWSHHGKSPAQIMAAEWPAEDEEAAA